VGRDLGISSLRLCQRWRAQRELSTGAAVGAAAGAGAGPKEEKAALLLGGECSGSTLGTPTQRL